MGLSDKGLGVGFMKNTSGAKSTLDEMEYMKLKGSEGGKFSVSSFYEEGGSLSVAKTLSRHYMNGGSLKRYQGGGMLRPLSGPDDYYSQDEINNMSEDQYNEAFPEDTTPVPGDTSAFIPQGPYAGVQPKKFMESLGDAFAQNESDWQEVVSTLTTPEFRNALPIHTRPENIVSNRKGLNEDFSEFDEVEVDAPAPRPTSPKARTVGAKAKGVVDPRIASRERAALGTTGVPEYQNLADDYQLDTSMIGDTPVYESEGLGEQPDWWSDNKGTIGKGLGNAAVGLLNIAPHLSNIKAYKNLPGVRAPNLQRTVRTKAPSFEASRQALKAEGRNAMNKVNASGQGTAAQNAAALAQTQSAVSRLSGQEAKAVADNDARNAAAANRVSGQNMNRLNRSLEHQMSRDMAKTRGIASEKGKIASKTLGFIGDLRNQELQERRLSLTERRYDRTGVMERDARSYLEENGEWPSWYSGNKS